MDTVFSRLAPWNDIRSRLATLLHEPHQPQLLLRLERLCLQISQPMDQHSDGAIFAVMQFDQSGAFAIKGSAGPISLGATARLPKLVAEAARQI
jgi:hypothetical protein